MTKITHKSLIFLGFAAMGLAAGPAQACEVCDGMADILGPNDNGIGVPMPEEPEESVLNEITPYGDSGPTTTADTNDSGSDNAANTTSSGQPAPARGPLNHAGTAETYSDLNTEIGLVVTLSEIEDPNLREVVGQELRRRIDEENARAEAEAEAERAAKEEAEKAARRAQQHAHRIALQQQQQAINAARAAQRAAAAAKPRPQMHHVTPKSITLSIPRG